MIQAQLLPHTKPCYLLGLLGYEPWLTQALVKFHSLLLILEATQQECTYLHIALLYHTKSCPSRAQRICPLIEGALKSSTEGTSEVVCQGCIRSHPARVHCEPPIKGTSTYPKLSIRAHWFSVCKATHQGTSVSPIAISHQAGARSPHPLQEVARQAQEVLVKQEVVSQVH